MTDALPMPDLVAALKAAAEPTRLRILLLLSRGELSVKDLTQILGSKPPRLSRHLKLLAEAGLIERFRDGSWVYFHVSDRTAGGHLARRLLAAVEQQDAVARRDRERFDALKRHREQAAQAYFRAHAQPTGTKSAASTCRKPPSRRRCSKPWALDRSGYSLIWAPARPHSGTLRQTLSARPRLRSQPVDARLRREQALRRRPPKH